MTITHYNNYDLLLEIRYLKSTGICKILELSIQASLKLGHSM